MPASQPSAPPIAIPDVAPAAVPSGALVFFSCAKSFVPRLSGNRTEMSVFRYPSARSASTPSFNSASFLYNPKTAVFLPASPRLWTLRASRWYRSPLMSIAVNDPDDSPRQRQQSYRPARWLSNSTAGFRPYLRELGSKQHQHGRVIDEHPRWSQSYSPDLLQRRPASRVLAAGWPPEPPRGLQRDRDDDDDEQQWRQRKDRVVGKCGGQSRTVVFNELVHCLTNLCKHAPPFRLGVRTPCTRR